MFGLVVLILVCLSIATMFTDSIKGKLLNSIINFSLMSILAIKDYGTGLTWFYILFLVLSVINAVLVGIYTRMYLEEKKGKKTAKVSNRDKFLNDIKKRYGS